MYQQQSMKLVMTTELRQAITILQFSAQDLTDYLHEQQLENPLIEISDPPMTEEARRRTAEVDIPEPGRIPSGKSGDSDVTALDFLREPEEGLRDHLLHQIRMSEAPDAIRHIMNYLALSLDENGYLEHEIDVYAGELGEEPGDVAEALSELQQLDPPGVGARNLTECLLIQLNGHEARDPLAEAIVRDHLDQLANKQFQKIAKALGVGVEDVEVVSDFLKTLNPKPGAVFHSTPAEYITPDVHVLKTGDELVVKLADGHLPRMTMNREYEQLLQSGGAEVASYMKQKQEQFHWIKRSIQQRQETILNVTKAIVRHQEDFFLRGADYLKPLNLKTIAEEIEVHESTVSRATVKKYAQTPKGLFELKYFFRSGFTGEGDDSADKVKLYLKRLIDEEEKKKPYSDQKIADLLEIKGIQVSRRTVAKYREELSIPSSSKRKRYT